MQDAEYVEISDRAWTRFSTIPGVHAVGIAKKVTGGVRTDETVVTVFVSKKLPLEELAAAAVVPPVFEGIRTDVVERAPLHTLQSPITVTPAAITSGGSFTFATTEDPPPIGNRISVTLTWHGGGEDKVFILSADSDGTLPLQAMLNVLVVRLNGPFFTPTLTGTTLGITVSNPATESLDASCYVTQLDTRTYAQEYLRGGIRIQGGSKAGGGTMGCVASLAPTPEYPSGRIVGVTCSHVVREFQTASTALVATDVGTAVDLSVPVDSANNPFPIRAYSVVSVALVRNGVEATAFYTTRPDEPLAAIAAGLVEALKKTGLPGVSAAITGTAPSSIRVLVTGFSGPAAHLECNVHGPVAFEGPLPLHAAAAKQASGDHVLTFSGAVDSANIGVFVDIDQGGFAATFGVYHNPPLHQRVADVAQAISTAINLTPSALRGLVSATAVGHRVTVAAAKDVRVWLEADVRVGQPIGFFATARPGCCNFRIGRASHARLDLDVALVQLDAALQYKHHVQEINAIAGTQAPALGMAVQKRGAATGLTEGMISAIATSGFITSGSLIRVYRNAAIVDSTITQSTGTWRGFAGRGDSGSVVVTRGPGPPKIVGVLFAGGIDATATITPADDIVSGFSSLGLSFTPAVGVDLNAVHTVPAGAVNLRAVDAEDARLVTGAFAARPFAALGERLREAEQEIVSTPMGREYAELVRRNVEEAFALVNHNRRVATVWHRSGGPAVLNAFLRVLRFDDEPLPREIDGRPLADCLKRLGKVFRRYASPQLSRDLERLTPQLADLSGLTYPQVLAFLRAGSRE